VVPSAVAFIALGDHIARVILQGGAFGSDAVRWQWLALGGAGVGLLAATLGRLYASALYALQDAKTPQRYAVTRVTLSLILGGSAAYWIGHRPDVDQRLGVACLMLASGLAAWVEFTLLKAAVRRRVGDASTATIAQIRVFLAAAVAAACAWFLPAAITMAGIGAHPIVISALVLGLYALVYGLMSWGLGVPEARAIVARLRPRAAQR
jgi:putative peptidoglycan lipid II flippase